MNKKILVNRAKCNYCGSIVESTTKHHLNICDCGKFYVDGGLDYLRRGGDNWIELSEFEKDISVIVEENKKYEHD